MQRIHSQVCFFLTSEVLLISDNIVPFLLVMLNPRTVAQCRFSVIL